jgi:hypothetical protein
MKTNEANSANNAKQAWVVCGVVTGFVIIALIIALTVTPVRSFTSLRTRFSGETRANEPIIDLVVTWVDGSDSMVRALKEEYAIKHHIKPDSAAVAPYRMVNTDELRYLLRSVERFAPWLRRVYILTSHHQRPRWLVDSHPRIRVVNDTEVFTDVTDLPSFNSHAFECHIHRLPDLAPRYLYACDDMFFGDHVKPSDFYRKRDGSPRVFTTGIAAPTAAAQGETFHEKAWFNNYRLLRARFGSRVLPTSLPMHQMVATSRAIADRCDALFPEELRKTSASKFRSAENVHPVGLQLYTALCEGAASETAHPPSSVYTGWFHDEPDTMTEYLAYIRQRQPKLVCINNVRGQHVGLYTDFVRAYFPEPSSFEI